MGERQQGALGFALCHAEQERFPRLREGRSQIFSQALSYPWLCRDGISA